MLNPVCITNIFKITLSLQYCKQYIDDNINSIDIQRYTFIQSSILRQYYKQYGSGLGQYRL